MVKRGGYFSKGIKLGSHFPLSFHFAPMLHIHSFIASSPEQGFQHNAVGIWLRCMAPYLESALVWRNFPFHFLSQHQQRSSVEVVRWTIFEEMEGGGGVLSFLPHDFAIFKNAGYWQNSLLAKKTKKTHTKTVTSKAKALAKPQQIVVKVGPDSFLTLTQLQKRRIKAKFILR